jgi:hypothetical protein
MYFSQLLSWYTLVSLFGLTPAILQSDARRLVTYFIGVGKLSNLIGSKFFDIAQWGIAGLGMSAIAHVSVTLMIASKIWWTTRSCKVIYPLMARSRYAAWIVLESGAVYSIAAVFVVVFGGLRTWIGGPCSTCRMFFYLILTQPLSIYGKELIPTLIIVRAGMGLTSENTTPKLATISLEFSVPRDPQVPCRSFPPEASVLTLDNNTHYVEAKISV